MNSFFALMMSILCNATMYCWNFVPFDDSMKIDMYKKNLHVTDQVVGVDGYQLYLFMRALYEKYNPSVLASQRLLKIPKIIHQIWLGGPVPEAFKGLMDNWKYLCESRGWQYRLWTDADVETFGLYNQAFYDETTNYGVKSDLLKWEIIYRYGGAYVDVDYEALTPLDELHYRYDFYTGIQPLDTHFLQLGAALFAAVPGHPVLKHCIETIKDDWHHQGAPKKSGPVHFTKSFFARAGSGGMKDIAFPATYFYPLGSSESILDYASWIAQGAYAVHHWAKSWMPRQYRPHKFQMFDNAEATATWND